MLHTRRKFLGLLVAGAVSTRVGAAAEALRATPRQTAGPFYPRDFPLDSDNDLVHVAGRDGIAGGIVSNVYGRIVDVQGRPISDAKVEIWQCDAYTRYHHIDDSNDAQIDENFQGYGFTASDGDGRYRFRTIKPVKYPGRTPHIHFRVTSGTSAELTTQMYVRGEPANESDGLFRRLGDGQARVLAEFVASADDSAELMARFDIVLG
jgi:protocatechuate 3,4-dioxygenase beta subunit